MVRYFSRPGRLENVDFQHQNAPAWLSRTKSIGQQPVPKQEKNKETTDSRNSETSWGMRVVMMKAFDLFFHRCFDPVFHRMLWVLRFSDPFFDGLFSIVFSNWSRGRRNPQWIDVLSGRASPSSQVFQSNRGLVFDLVFRPVVRPSFRTGRNPLEFSRENLSSSFN